MNNFKKEVLKKVLISGEINVEMYKKIKEAIFAACSMTSNDSRDRANWSNWINGNSIPNRFCQKQINTVLNNFNLPSIYDETIDN